LLGFAVVCLAVTFVFTRGAWHSLDVGRIINAPQSLLVYDKDGQEVSCLYYIQNRIFVPLDTMPQHLIDALIATEDTRFFEHHGIDIIRLGGAMLQNVLTLSWAEGGSTLTQQLIKLSHLTLDKTIIRKIDEAILAWQLEQRYSKEQILEMYLNFVYFGNGCHGVEAAARIYFNVHASELSLSQSALLVGVLRSPALFSPHLRPEASVGRRNHILGLMAEQGFITDAQAQEARQDPLILVPDPINGVRGYYVDSALTSSCEILDVDMVSLLTGGYRIYTPLDQDLQAISEDAFAQDRYFPRIVAPLPGGGRKVETAAGAMVIVDASNGGVAAIMGGRDNDIALAFNRATRIRRQTGSAIKPVLVYAPALLNGYTAAGILPDQPIDFGDYSPQNAGGRYAGWITFREMVTGAANVPAVAVFSTLNIERSKVFAQAVGIPFDPRDTELALALGGFTYGVSPVQLAGAYTAFAGGGVYREPHILSHIGNWKGVSLFTQDTKGKRVMDVGNAFILNSLQQGVVESGAASRLADLDMGLAAQTGTAGDSAGNRDIWLAAYNPQYVAVVWMGFDNPVHKLPPHTGGGTLPAELLYEVFSRAYENETAPTFAMPETVFRARPSEYPMQVIFNEPANALSPMFIPDSFDEYSYFVRCMEPTIFNDFYRISPPAPSDVSAIRAGRTVTVRFTPLSALIEYYVYRMDQQGYAALLRVVRNTVEPQTITDPVRGLLGSYSYFVVPVRPDAGVNGLPLIGPSSKPVNLLLYPTT